MGMYDTLRCDYPLPDERYQGETFQTKSMERTLAHYVITANGRLMFYEPTFEDASGWQFTNENLDKLPDKGEEVLFHGDIEFVTLLVVGDDSPRLARFVARFNNGQIAWIKKIDEQATPSSR